MTVNHDVAASSPAGGAIQPSFVIQKAAFLCKEAYLLAISHNKDNEAARSLYHSFGFEETGETDDDELIAVMKN